MEGGCNFPAGYSGPRCEHVRGRLRIYLQKGENLLNVDKSGDAQDVSDPWLSVEAFDHNGRRSKKRSPIVSNTLNPPWYRWLDFGVSDRGWFTVQAFDNSGEKLSYGFT